jgi:hypothetical protein
MVEPEPFPGKRKYPGPAVDPTEGPGLAPCNVQLSFKIAGTLAVPILMTKCLHWDATIIFSEISSKAKIIVKEKKSRAMIDEFPRNGFDDTVV